MSRTWAFGPLAPPSEKRFKSDQERTARMILGALGALSQSPGYAQPMVTASERQNCISCPPSSLHEPAAVFGCFPPLTLSFTASESYHVPRMLTRMRKVAELRSSPPLRVQTGLGGGAGHPLQLQ